jgi:FAD/FMN-containing dehydrogenase
MALPTTRAADLMSYGGQRVRCELAEPRDPGELAELLADCHRRGRSVTLRCGGYSLDGQALNRELVISLAQLTGLTIDAAGARAQAGVATRWRDVVAGALAHGCMPPVVVSGSGTSVGGTLASNSISRFTPVRGKEIRHITRLELTTPGGESLTCSRDLNADVFRGVIGGLGYLGAVTRVELALDRGAPPAVQTQILGLLPQADVLEGLLPTTTGVPDARTPTRYSVLLPGLARGFLYESSYLDHATRWRRYRPVHQPRSLARLAGELLLRNRATMHAVWWGATHAWSSRPYVDPVCDFTFFMDGNTRLVRLGRRLGRTMGAAEQTFILPLGAPPTAPAAEFLAICQEVFARSRLTPALTDVLHVPADDGVLSSSAQLDGFAITFGFVTSRRALHDRIRGAFAELAARCATLHGRVHLTKNVVADPAVLAAMYADAIPRFRALKARLDPGWVLRNDFLTTNFPGLAAA